MKWLKFLKDVKDHKIGEMISMPEAAAKTLVDAGIAEYTEEPKDVKDAAAAVKIDVEAYVKQIVTEVVEATVKASMPKPDPSKKPADIKTHDNEDDDPKMGFKSVTEQALAVKSWCMNTKQDERLKRFMAKAPTTYASEGIGPDGGFLLAPEFARELLRYTFPDNGLFNRCRSFTTSSNQLTIPRDETVPWSSTGVRAFWTSEAAQMTATKPVYAQDNLVLHKLTAMVPVTDEMNSDAFLGLGQYLNTVAGERIRYKVDEAVVNGTGAGQPLGFMNSGAIIEEAKETSQTADTIVIENIAKMFSRVPLENFSSLVWLVHPSAFPQLITLKVGDTPIFVAPSSGARDSIPTPSLFGVPVLVSQQCQGVGDAGDIMLVDCSKYIVVTKGSGIEVAMSIHLYFDYNLQTWRFNFRAAGQPWMRAPVTSAYGSYTMSGFVKLAARA